MIPYMFRSITLSIFRGCSYCNAAFRFVVFVTTLFGHVVVYSICVVVMCTHDNNANRKYRYMPR